MDKQHQYTRFCFLSICIGSIALVFAISRNCSISFFDYSLQKLEFSFQESELRRSFHNAAGDENRVVDSRDVVSQQILSVRSRNSTVSQFFIIVIIMMIGTVKFKMIVTVRFSYVNVCVLNQLRIKPENKKKKLNRRRMVEVGLSRARDSIREAAASSSNRNATFFNLDLPNTLVYRNPSALHQ